jgi:hypothetical protein
MGDRRSLGAFGDGFREAFATRVFFGVGRGVGLGVLFGFGLGVATGFGVDVALGVGFGVGDGNSISLLAVVATGFSSSTSSSFAGVCSIGGGVVRVVAGDGSFSG